MKHLIGRPMTKKVKFLGEELTIKKLTVAQVLEIQEMTKSLQDTDKDNSMDVLCFVVSNAVEGAEDLTSSEIQGFPLDELSKLSNDILEYSGLGNGQKK